MLFHHQCQPLVKLHVILLTEETTLEIGALSTVPQNRKESEQFLPLLLEKKTQKAEGISSVRNFLNIQSEGEQNYQKAISTKESKVEVIGDVSEFSLFYSHF